MKGRAFPTGGTLVRQRIYKEGEEGKGGDGRVLAENARNNARAERRAQRAKENHACTILHHHHHHHHHREAARRRAHKVLHILYLKMCS